MKLNSLEGKVIRLIDANENVFEGRVTDYIYPEDNEPEGVESIILREKSTSHLIEFYSSDIKSIEII